MRQFIRGLQPASGVGAGRDLRADAFRGIALWFILIDHMPGNRLGGLTLRNIALCDATEGFVLLAGYAAGIAYGATLDRRSWSFAAASLLRRVGTLYVAHIFLFVVFTAQVGYSAAALESSAYLDELHLDVFGEQPYLALLQALLLRFQPAFLDILPMYIVLLLLLVPALPLLRRPALLMALSGIAYVAVRLFDLNLPNWTGGGWFFNPLAWQVLFFTGAALGYAPPRPGAGRSVVPVVPFHPGLVAASVVTLALSAAVLLVGDYREHWLAELPLPLAELLTTIDKTGLHPFRLLSILALAYLLGHAVPRHAPWLRGRLAAPFVLMGQHGLPVFCAGIFLAFLGRLALEMDDRWLMQAAVNMAGLAALVSIGVVAGWYRLREKGEARYPAAAAADRLQPAAASSTTAT
ncbi:OpgC domain-containing protein [Paeniroseomonas aquatica]|uniref:OpgC domain-containing protein n=1 Tax=Paeniroseomonas aquatica TaxID=373043 RepID=A0ABT8AFL7_9PROT|nr:OpgC domain-containing protein [Paeniroseomonas aquatica]MDN3568276.1 OpgC domain-containing protein [Paeniroseomonas aquatica]